MIRAFAVAAALLTFAMLLVLACSDAPPLLGDTGNLPGDASPGSASCATPQAGCDCPSNGELVQCGEVSSITSDGRTVCALGFRRCIGNKWSQCDALDRVTPRSGSAEAIHTANFILFEGGVGPGCTACDPNCQQAASVEPDGGVVAVSTPFDAALNGPPNPIVGTILTDAGISLDGAIYHELGPDATAFDPLTVTTSVNSVDIYFLLNSTAATQASIGQLANQIPTVVSSIQGVIPSVGFGLGRFTNYQAWPYASQSNGNTVYANMQNIDTNGTLTVNKVQAMPTNAGGVCPGDPSCFQNTPYIVAQSTATALYAMATNEPLIGWAAFAGFAQPDWWYNVYKYYGQRASAGQAPFIASNGTCPGGTIGAACFRNNAFHIVMLLQDAPMDSGPGGSFPYYQMKPRYFPYNLSADYTVENAWYWFYSSSLGGTPAVPSLPVDNGAAQALAIPAANVGKPIVQFGNVAAGANSNQLTTATVYDASAKMTCTINGAGPIATGPDVYWDFTVPAGGTRYWFDTVGTSYDSILYLIDRNSGKVMACADDSFPWLSAVNVGTTAAVQGIAATESAILGDLPLGDYRLVLDKFSNTAMPAVPGVVGAVSQTGVYQINMWMDITDPRMSGNPRFTGVSAPGYTQTLNALKVPALGAMVMGLEMSGVDCGQTSAAWEKNWTRWSLERLAIDTGAVVGGTPQVFSIKQDGSPGPVAGPGTAKCPAGANLGAVVSSAIQNLTGNLAQPVTVKVVDTDDLTDFDGTSGTTAGPLVLTPGNIDDATFVSSITANPVAGCTGPTSLATRVAASGLTTAGYAGCNAGAQPNITFEFSVPPTVGPKTNVQIFRFNVEVYFGSTLMQRTPVVLAIPPAAFAAYDFIRDFDASGACRADQRLIWGKYSWNQGGCGAVPCIPLENPPTVNDVVDAYIAWYVTPSETSVFTSGEISSPLFVGRNLTQTGAVDVGAFLTSQSVTGASPYLRIRAHVVPTADQFKTPILANWNLTIACKDWL